MKIKDLYIAVGPRLVHVNIYGMLRCSCGQASNNFNWMSGHLYRHKEKELPAISDEEMEKILCEMAKSYKDMILSIETLKVR